MGKRQQAELLGHLADAIRARQPAGFAKFRERLRREAPGSSYPMLIDGWPLLDAIASEQWGRSAFELLVIAYATANGRGDHQCFCCCRRWSKKRPPATFAVISFPDFADYGLGVGICDKCSNARNFRAKVLAAAQRDLGADPKTARHIHDQGHA